MCVTVINVGYGDAILFQLKNGYTALLDGGSALESEFEGDSYRISMKIMYAGWRRYYSRQW